MKLYTLREVSQHAGLGIEALHRLINKGRLAALQPGGQRGKYFVPQDELDRLLQRVSTPKGKK